jgi:hypothetical protein
MARPPIIPENLLPIIMEKVNNGANAETISAWLRLEHDLDASVRVVNDRIQALRRVEHEAKKAAIADAAAKSALDCVSMLDNRILQLNDIASVLLNDNDIDTKLAGKQMAETLLKYIDKKMNLTGMDKVDNIETDDIVEGLLSKLGK